MKRFAALYRALGRAHDFALAADADPDSYRALLADGSALVMRLVSRDCERMSSQLSRAAAE